MKQLYQVTQDADFDVEKQPIYYLDSNDEMEQEVEIPNRYALINSITRKPLSVVSNKYKIRKY